MLALLLLACSFDAASRPPDTMPLPFTLTELVTVTQPTAIAAPPGPGGVVYVVEQPGRIVEVEGKQVTPVGDISGRVACCGERGLLGLAFHPRWPEDPRVFVNYTYDGPDGGRTRIASFVLRDGALDPDSEVEIVSYDQPWGNHNSGALAFGPDGMLYVAVGDGGSANDPRGTGQRRDDLLGSILRLDVATVPYAVPPDNPFVGQEGVRPEIWAYGVRNPWGMAFDGDTLWFADVGQNTWEEVNRGVKGANYGWNVMEATHCFQAVTCERDGLTLPLAEYKHDVGQSVTGGLVYRGPSIPALDGKFVYADFASGVWWAVGPDGAATKVGDSRLNPSQFGRDGDGRLYVGHYGGRLFRVDP